MFKVSITLVKALLLSAAMFLKMNIKNKSQNSLSPQRGENMRKTGKKDLYLKRHSLVRIGVVILVLQAFVSFPALGETKLTGEISKP